MIWLSHSKAMSASRTLSSVIFAYLWVWCLRVAIVNQRSADIQRHNPRLFQSGYAPRHRTQSRRARIGRVLLCLNSFLKVLCHE